MKKYKITWYHGTIEGKVIASYYEKIVKAENIDKVNYMSILRDGVKSYYQRVLLFSDKLHVIDYGSHSDFIKVEEIE